MSTRPPETRQLIRLRGRAQELIGTLRMARALHQEGRAIDLAGLEQQIGQLCAYSLDLPAEAGQRLRQDLIALQAETAALIAALRP